LPTFCLFKKPASANSLSFLSAVCLLANLISLIFMKEANDSKLQLKASPFKAGMDRKAYKAPFFC